MRWQARPTTSSTQKAIMAYQRLPSSPYRSFTSPATLGTSRTKDNTSELDVQEVLFCHNATRIVSFTSMPFSPVPKSPLSENLINTEAIGELPWKTRTGTTIAAGQLKVYRVPGSVVFLQSGKTIRPLLSKSQCWCLDGESIFALRVSTNTYYRIEIPKSSAADLQAANQLKSVFAQILQYETTPCPFEREFSIELPKSPHITKRPWRPKSVQSVDDAQQRAGHQVEKADTRKHAPTISDFRTTQPSEGECAAKTSLEQYEDMKPSATSLFTPQTTASTNYPGDNVEQLVATFEELDSVSTALRSSGSSLLTSPPRLERQETKERQWISESTLLTVSGQQNPRQPSHEELKSAKMQTLTISSPLCPLPMNGLDHEDSSTSCMLKDSRPKLLSENTLDAVDDEIALPNNVEPSFNDSGFRSIETEFCERESRLEFRRTNSGSDCERKELSESLNLTMENAIDQDKDDHLSVGESVDSFHSFGTSLPPSNPLTPLLSLSSGEIHDPAQYDLLPILAEPVTSKQNKIDEATRPRTESYDSFRSSSHPSECVSFGDTAVNRIYEHEPQISSSRPSVSAYRRRRNVRRTSSPLPPQETLHIPRAISPSAKLALSVLQLIYIIILAPSLHFLFSMFEFGWLIYRGTFRFKGACKDGISQRLPCSRITQGSVEEHPDDQEDDYGISLTALANGTRGL